MKGLENKYFTYLSNQQHIGVYSNIVDFTPPSRDEGNRVDSYPELLEKIASIKFNNPAFEIFFRGQSKDYSINASGGQGSTSSLYPSIFRNVPNKPPSSISSPDITRKRFEILDQATQHFIDLVDEQLENYEKRIFKRIPILRWAILQHYEICDTPLLDVTPTLNIALSFAIGAGNDPFYLYGIAMPRQTQVVTTSIIAETTSINLTQICPPSFHRPHFQNGYLLGEYPSVINYETQERGETKSAYNFSRRLIAKFIITNPNSILETGFDKLDNEILLPNANDKLMPIVKEVGNRIEGIKDELNKLIWVND